MDKSVVIIESASGEVYEFAGPVGKQLKQARLFIKQRGGEWAIRVDRYSRGQLVDSRKIKR